MRRMQRLVLLTTIALIAPALAGCADGFDMDKLDVFHLNDKKKLPGDRQPVFPEGVPGVTQGVPQEYMKGNAPPSDTALLPPPDAPAAKQAAAAPPEPPKAKPAAKPKPKKTAKRAAPKPKPQAVPVQPVNRQAEPAPAPAPWPTPAQGQASGAAPWPSAPPPGTFSR
jgi:hypothetical protein